MQTTFKYNGVIITTPNLEKKLKRMKITIDDVEIIDNPIVIKKEEKEELTHRKLVIKTPDNYYHISYIPKDSPIPSAYDLLKKNLWNGQTGIKEFTEEYLKGCVYEEKDTLLAL